MSAFHWSAEREIVDDCKENALNEIKDKLLFQRGVLLLLKETRLFGPLIEKAVEDLDSVMEKLNQI